MIKNILPKSPLAAAGVGLLLGVGIAGVKGWLDVKKGDATQKDAVANAVKQGILFGGVAAASTLAGGNKGGGAGLATMAVMGLSGGGGNALPAMLTSLSGGMSGGGRGGGMGGGGGGRGGAGGGQGQKGGGQSSSSILDTVSDTVSDILVSVVNKKQNVSGENGIKPALSAAGTNSASDAIDVDVAVPIEKSVSTAR